MKNGWLSLGFASTALFLLALLPAARATTIRAPDFDGLVGKSDYIIRAVVKSVTSEWRANPDKPGHRYIGTLVELEVKEVIKGTPPSPLILDLVGGRIADRELTIEGSPRFTVGQENILFVKGNGRQVVPLVGMSHGYYQVRRDKITGRDHILRSNGNPLYDEQEVSLPAAGLGANPARPISARPLSSEEFVTRIRQSAKFSTRENIE